MPQNESGFLTKLAQSGATTFITTIVAALTTYYITSNFKEKEQREVNHEKEKVRMEASAENNSRILTYERKLDSMTRENGRLRMQLQPDERRAEPEIEPLATNVVSNVLVNGTWISADGAEIWTFNNGTIQVTAANGYNGAIESSGTYQVAGGNLTGNLHLSRFLYIPVNLNAVFSVSMGSDNNSLIGTIHMNNNTSAMALYRQH
jgi:hypothetical protein